MHAAPAAAYAADQNASNTPIGHHSDSVSPVKHDHAPAPLWYQHSAATQRPYSATMSVAQIAQARSRMRNPAPLRRDRYSAGAASTRALMKTLAASTTHPQRVISSSVMPLRSS